MQVQAPSAQVKATVLAESGTYGELVRLQGLYAARQETELQAWRSRKT